MNLELPVFNLKRLKQSFYYFLVINFILTVISIVLVALFGEATKYNYLDKINYWVLFLILFVPSYLFGLKSKAELKKISESTDFEQQFSKYESFYKKRLIGNGISFAVTGLLFVLTLKNTFFYILLFQLLLSLVFYPRKSLISKELNNSEIELI